MRLLPICLLLLVGGCAAAEPRTAGRPDLLARELEGRVAGAPQQCAPTTPDGTLRAVNADTLVLRRGTMLYVNRLAAPCPGLRRDDRLIVESFNGDRFCRGDRVRSLPIGTSIPGAICPLSEFVPYGRQDR